MPLPTLAAWSIIVGLALMLVGGLVMWAYGARKMQIMFGAIGPEVEATRDFHTRLVRWFFVYGVSVIALGLALLAWGGKTFL